jgi:DNA-binding NarL/FixJ family response regulator
MEAHDAVTVLVVDDHPPFRQAARAVVRATPGFRVVGEAQSGEEAVDRAGDLQPALVLMDVRMDGIGGVEATRRIVEAFPSIAVVLVSSYRQEDVPSDADRCGAVAYLSKERFGQTALETVWSAALTRRTHRDTSGQLGPDGGSPAPT